MTYLECPPASQGERSVGPVKAQVSSMSLRARRGLPFRHPPSQICLWLRPSVVSKFCQSGDRKCRSPVMPITLPKVMAGASTVFIFTYGEKSRDPICSYTFLGGQSMVCRYSVDRAGMIRWVRDKAGHEANRQGIILFYVGSIKRKRLWNPPPPGDCILSPPQFSELDI